MATAHLENENGSEYDAPFETVHVYLNSGWTFALPEGQAVYEDWKSEDDARQAAEKASVSDLDPKPAPLFEFIVQPVEEDKKKK